MKCWDCGGHGRLCERCSPRHPRHGERGLVELLRFDLAHEEALRIETQNALHIALCCEGAVEAMRLRDALQAALFREQEATHEGHRLRKVLARLVAADCEFDRASRFRVIGERGSGQVSRLGENARAAALAHAEEVARG